MHNKYCRYRHIIEVGLQTKVYNRISLAFIYGPVVSDGTENKSLECLTWRVVVRLVSSLRSLLLFKFATECQPPSNYKRLYETICLCSLNHCSLWICKFCYICSCSPMPQYSPWFSHISQTYHYEKPLPSFLIYSLGISPLSKQCT
jgi:hypothetical protein